MSARRQTHETSPRQDASQEALASATSPAVAGAVPPCPVVPRCAILWSAASIGICSAGLWVAAGPGQRASFRAQEEARSRGTSQAAKRGSSTSSRTGLSSSCPPSASSPAWRSPCRVSKKPDARANSTRERVPQSKKNASFTSNLGRTFFESQYNIFTSKDLDGSRIVITCDAYDSGCLYACKCMQFAMMSCARNFVRVFPGTQLTGFVHVMYLAVSGYTSTCSGAMRAKVKQSMAPSVRLYRHDCNSC